MTDWPYGMIVRPIQQWPGKLRTSRARSNFSAPWRSTLLLLDKEISAIGGRRVVLQVAIPEQQFRLDGYPRAHAVQEHPGVVLALESTHGPLQYPCDAFDRWQDNLRAIALSLEALRKVDRYGVAGHGQQYTGWKQIGSGSMSEAAARTVLAEWAGLTHEPTAALDLLVKRARIRAHPDRNGGDRTAWDRIEQAARVLTGAMS